MKSKRIVITGGGGFIGSHLCEKLIGNGHTVICIDNFKTSKRQNIEQLQKLQNFQLIIGDTREITSDNLPFTGKVDEIYDLASPASVTYISEHPIEAATINAMGTKNLLDIAKLLGATFLFASSSEVYGDPQQPPQRESYWGNVNPIGIRSGYDEGKRFGETLTEAYQR